MEKPQLRLVRVGALTQARAGFLQGVLSAGRHAASAKEAESLGTLGFDMAAG